MMGAGGESSASCNDKFAPNTVLRLRCDAHPQPRPLHSLTEEGVGDGGAPAPLTDVFSLPLFSKANSPRSKWRGRVDRNGHVIMIHSPARVVGHQLREEVQAVVERPRLYAAVGQHGDRRVPAPPPRCRWSVSLFCAVFDCVRPPFPRRSTAKSVLDTSECAA
jgi:hypothetical protein